MYKIVANPRAWWTVTWPGVTEEGEVVENRIELRFIIHSEDEHLGLSSEAARLTREADAQSEAEAKPLSAYFTEFLKRIAVDWRGVHAENGDPLKWEDDNIRLLMNQPGVFEAAVSAYADCRRGRKDVRAGN